jgi:hypothetical protein
MAVSGQNNKVGIRLCAPLIHVVIDVSMLVTRAFMFFSSGEESFDR